jgi:hypothetical protein
MLPLCSDPLDTAAWQAALVDLLERPVQVCYGRSRTTPVQVRSTVDGGVAIRLHHMFAAAPAEIVAALAAWIRVGRRARRASATLDGWIAGRLCELPRPLPGRLLTRGAVHHLGALLPDIIRRHIPELRGAPPPITWGRRTRSRGIHSLHLGSFDPETRVIRIHPVLDHRRVPEFFVSFILFHELLHALMHALMHAAAPPGPDGRARRAHHPPEFRRRESAHPDYDRALRWEGRELPDLLRRARRGCRRDS